MVDGKTPDDPGGGANGGRAPRSADGDELLRSLGALAAEQQREGARSPWERLARGELTPDEIAELERRAGESDDAKALLAAARPLDAHAHERITAALAARLAPERRRARWQVVTSIGAGALGLAAAALLFVRASPTADLPRYALESSGAATSRAPSAPSTVCVLRASEQGSFEVLARPDDPVNGPLAARAFVLRGGSVRGGSVEPWRGELDVSSKGSIRLVDENRKLVGATELRIVVGRPDHVDPARARELAAAPAASGSGWQVLRCAVEAP